MNSPTVAPKSRHRVWPWVVGLMLAPFLALAGMAWSAVHLSREAAVLRRQVMAASGGRWQVRVQFTADRIALAAARGGLALIKDVPREARDVLAAVRSASVGVYGCARQTVPSAQGDVVTEADIAMARSGWKRLVGVVEPDRIVLIYLPVDAETTKPSRVCLAVCDRRDLVIVSAEIDPEALAQFALRQIDRRTMARL